MKKKLWDVDDGMKKWKDLTEGTDFLIECVQVNGGAEIHQWTSAFFIHFYWDCMRQGTSKYLMIDKDELCGFLIDDPPGAGDELSIIICNVL